ncbi:putative type VI secretion system effector [Citrobacter europaeus]|uniref:putative type VI secretion system effector n=1 Tax=Citrobacter europaeus TaxID=1914243 RepID=UPI00388DF7F3
MKKELKFSDGLRRSLEGSNKKYPLHNYLQQKSELARTQEILRNIEARNEKGKWLAHFRLKEKELLDVLKNAPPDPVLPPPAPLIKVRGVIEKLTQRRVVQYFDVLSYPEGSAYYARYKKKMAASAVVWAASGSGGTASALLQDYDRALCGAWYLTGRINGRRFSGWLGYHWCYEGEEVELLAAPVGEEYLVYAIHKPEEQSLCMTPGCYRGKNQARRAAVRIPLWVCYLCFAISIAALLCGDGLASFYDPMFYLFIVEAIIFLLVMCLLPAAWSIYKHKPLPEETLSEEIFTLLGWENVADINLDTRHKRRKKEWKRTGIPPNPLRKGTPFDHSGIRAGIFYY